MRAQQQQLLLKNALENHWKCVKQLNWMGVISWRNSSLDCEFVKVFQLTRKKNHHWGIARELMRLIIWKCLLLCWLLDDPIQTCAFYAIACVFHQWSVSCGSYRGWYLHDIKKIKTKFKMSSFVLTDVRLCISHSKWHEYIRQNFGKSLIENHCKDSKRKNFSNFRSIFICKCVKVKLIPQTIVWLQIIQTTSLHPNTLHLPTTQLSFINKIFNFYYQKSQFM